MTLLCVAAAVLVSLLERWQARSTVKTSWQTVILLKQ
jgi:hypothetical protein